MSKRRYSLDERAASLLRERYDSKSETISHLCRALAVPRYTVKQWAQALGLARTKERRWSDREITYLEANLHRLHVTTLAKKLRRTTTAVALKAKRLGLRKCDEGYTLRSLAIALGVDDHKVASWVRQGLLRAGHRNTDHERDFYLITEQAVRDLIVSHPLEVNVRRADGLWLIDLLTNGGGA